MSFSARGGYEYYVTFIDDYSIYEYVYLMNHKSETFDKFKEFREEVEKGLPVKELRSDRGGEYLFDEFLRIWGCMTYVLDKDARKLDSWIELCMFVGYPKGINGGLFYNSKEQTVIVSTHATFLEESYMNGFKPRSKEVLEKISRNIQNLTEKVVELTLNNRPTNGHQHREHHHSERVSRKPEFFQSSKNISNTESVEKEDDDTLTYDEVMRSADSKL
ncbi:hypothetical protein CXB51_001537 [Gossypium anomalum]|uniref:Retroviral polymerase SH3-like domain-containing protein n=1 Tax=Gossypium anomalum TaxID=47600 RepID=A0A8J6DF31_9ROSI|nr:hypothetical protein CXB51_001537 [Gossypium anomalum]